MKDEKTPVIGKPKGTEVLPSKRADLCISSVIGKILAKTSRERNVAGDEVREASDNVGP